MSNPFAGTISPTLKWATKLFIGLILLFPTNSVFAEQEIIQPTETETTQQQKIIHTFEREDCQHCQDQFKFLKELQNEDSSIIIHKYDVTHPVQKENFQKFATKHNIPQTTPTTIIGNTFFQGFESPETTGTQIQSMLNNIETQYESIEDVITSETIENSLIQSLSCNADEECDATHYTPYLVDIPFLGPRDVKAYSLGSMSLILGFIDGFNPCAMWVLVTFLLILIQIGDRKKMIQIAGLFIVAETIMYYLILNFWLTAWDFVGLDQIITKAVGLLSIGGAIFFLYEWKTSDGTCKVTNLEQRSKTRNKIKDLVSSPLTIATSVGIIGLALSVNIIEFACSIGIPQAFTKILDINNLNSLQKQFYIFLYTLMYMVDDLIVFGLAFFSIEKIGLTTKYSKWCNLIGGILMLALGLTLIINPELLA